MVEEKLFKKVINRLKKFDIPYMLTGGLAVTIWGRLRSTLDIDIVINLKERDRHKIIEAFKKDFYVDEEDLDLAYFKNLSFNIINLKTIEKIDFYFTKEDDEYERIKFNRRKTKKILGIKIDVISPEDLILTKLIWYKESNSTRHLEDALSVLKISKVNLEYIKKWASRCSIKKILEELLIETRT